MTTTPTRIAVLGLGRMGAAMASRLIDQGHDVIGWTRSGHDVTGVTTVPTAADAVADAPIVVLCLFDGPACRDVLELIRDRIAGKAIVNTSTVGPADATGLAAEVAAAGASYVHAPVIGSVPAVAGGTLTVLAGGDEYDDVVGSVLGDLGDVVRSGSPAESAAAKLVANGGLGSALLVIRDGRMRAEQLGLDAEQTWTVLERTAVGGLVRGKRQRLEARDFGAADFTTRALLKDLELLAGGAPAAYELRDQVAAALADGSVGPEDDIAALCLTGPAGDPTAEHQFTLAAGIDPSADAVAPLAAYVAGHGTGDPSHFRRAFLPTAHIEGLRDGEFVSWTVDDYVALFPGHPADDEPTRRRRLDHLAIDGTVGTASMTLWHGDSVFTDVFVLLQSDGEWRIANKAYHRH